MKQPGTSGRLPVISDDIISPYATSKEVVQYMTANEDKYYASIEKKAAAIDSEPEDTGYARASENAYVLHSLM